MGRALPAFPRFLHRQFPLFWGRGIRDLFSAVPAPAAAGQRGVLCLFLGLDPALGQAGCERDGVGFRDCSPFPLLPPAQGCWDGHGLALGAWGHIPASLPELYFVIPRLWSAREPVQFPGLQQWVLAERGWARPASGCNFSRFDGQISKYSPLSLVLENWQELAGEHRLLEKPELIRLSRVIRPIYKLGNNQEWPNIGSIDEELITSLMSGSEQTKTDPALPENLISTTEVML